MITKTLKGDRKIVASRLLTLACCVPAMARGAAPKQSVRITNADIFNGKSEKLASSMSVLVEGNKIPKSLSAPTGVTVIDAKS